MFTIVIPLSLYGASAQHFDFMPYLENLELARRELTPEQYTECEDILKALEPCEPNSEEILKLREAEQHELQIRKEHQVIIAKMSTELQTSCLKAEEASKRIRHNALLIEAENQHYQRKRLMQKTLEAEQTLSRCIERIARLQKSERDRKERHDAEDRELRKRERSLAGSIWDKVFSYEPTPMPDYGVKDEIKVLEQKKHEALLYLDEQRNKSDNCGIPRKDIQKPLLIKDSEPYAGVLGEKSSEVPSDVDLPQKDLRKSGDSAQVPSKKRL